VHYFAGLLNADEQLLTAGEIPTVGILLVARVPISHPRHLILAIQFKSKG
jgi:hypothetical protein